MGHPMARKSFRKRGDKFLKHQHQNGRYGFNQQDNDSYSKNLQFDKLDENENDDDAIYTN